jgi:NAD/NADP transhydrogenase beta subunit
MADKKTSKKITNVEGDNISSSSESGRVFTPTEENSKKAKMNRIISAILWAAGIGIEIFAIIKLKEVPINMTLLIVLIVAILILVVIANVLWKKANRLDPASEKNKTKFFIQNQLGLIISVLAFLPLVVLILKNKNLSGKQKGILGAVAGVALVIAGMTGTEFNPVSQEQYAEQTAQVELLNDGVNNVYWTKSGKSYHLYQDCGYINSDRTTEIFQGTVSSARELKNITDLCDRCGNKAKKAKGIE